MVFKDVDEGGVVVDEDVDCLVADKVYFLSVLLLHLLSAHCHYLGVLLLPCLHPAVEIATHAHALELDIDLAQQVISRHFLVSVAHHPGLAQELVSKVFGLDVAVLGQENASDELVKLQLYVPLKVIVNLRLPVVEGFQGPVKVIERKGVAAILEQNEPRKGTGAVDVGGRAQGFDDGVEVIYTCFYLQIRVNFLVHVL